MQMNYSLNVANSVGGSNRAPILIPTEYNGWTSRMRNYLKTKGKDIWRSVEEGPHLLTITPRPNTAEEALGGTSQPRLTPLDIEKMDNDQIALTEIQCGIPPELFDLEAKDQKLVSSLSEYTHFSTFAGESLRQAFTRFSIIVTRLLSPGAERTNQEINLRFLEGLGKDWVLVKMILQDSGKLKTFNMYRLYNNLIGQEHDIKGNQQQLQLGGPLPLVAEHNYPTMGNTPQQLVQYHQTTQQQINPNTSTPQTVSIQQPNTIPSYHPSQPQTSYPSYYQNPTVQYQSSPTSQPSIQSKTPTLARPAPVQTTESSYSEYDEAEEAAYQHEIAMISQNTNQVQTPEKNESEVIKYHNCGGLWHYAADCRALRNYPKVKEDEKVKAFVASGNVEIWSSGDEDKHFENKRK
ncbi:hypothetical protein L1887_17817 [Cichorium endivia]|nr:hypothetical protein L1887_17817 [Cichorium endivia]